jgi:hypothetical protein
MFLKLKNNLNYNHFIKQSYLITYFCHNEDAMSLHLFTKLDKMDMPHHQFNHIVYENGHDTSLI